MSDGILIVDKPAGVTSAEVVRRVKGRSRIKVGHLGTLDPFATGVLPLCIGEATKIAQFLSVADKRYEGLIRLGTATDTGDRTGTAVRSAPIPTLDDEALSEAERRFTGSYVQTPPMYSALKRDGVPLYKLARQGIEIERESRAVSIASLRLFPADDGGLGFEVGCSKGTYVRVLAEDVAASLGTVGHLETLRRTQFGPFDLSLAVSLPATTPLDPTSLVSIRSALSHLPSIGLGAQAAAAARQGQAWVLRDIAVDGEVAALLDPVGEVAAVVVRRAGRWEFGRVLRTEVPLHPETPMVGEQD